MESEFCHCRSNPRKSELETIVRDELEIMSIAPPSASKAGKLGSVDKEESRGLAFTLSALRRITECALNSAS